MRSKKQQIYDNFYYGFERWLIIQSANSVCRKKLRGQKVGREFNDIYKNTFCPYWAQFGVKPSRMWVKYYYLLTGSADPRYIPDDLLARDIIPHFNNQIFVVPLADKNLNSMIYPQAKRPETVFKRMSGGYCEEDFTPIPEEEAVARLSAEGHYFIKPTRNTSEGADVCSFRSKGDADAVRALLKQYECTDYIVQRAVKQHPGLAALNESSVNTIRMITLLFRGEPVLLSAILRIGNPGSSVDNIGAGGYQCNIRPDGTLDEVAYTHGSGRDDFVTESKSGLHFGGAKVPCYDKVRETALELAKKTPYHHYVAWDFAVDETGDPVLIEYNVHVPGQNQETSGPTFGDITDEVLAEVYGRRK